MTKVEDKHRVANNGGPHRDGAIRLTAKIEVAIGEADNPGKVIEDLAAQAFAKAEARVLAGVADEAERRAGKLLDSAVSMLKIADVGAVSTAARALAYSTFARDLRSGTWKVGSK